MAVSGSVTSRFDFHARWHESTATDIAVKDNGVRGRSEIKSHCPAVRRKIRIGIQDEAILCASRQIVNPLLQSRHSEP